MNLLWFIVGFIMGIAALLLYAYWVSKACKRTRIETRAEIRAKYRACHKAYMNGYNCGFRQNNNIDRRY